MKNIPAVLVLLPALLVASVSACEAQTRFEREILSALEVYVEATNSGDPEAVADLYVDSPAPNPQEVRTILSAHSVGDIVRTGHPTEMTAWLEAI